MSDKKTIAIILDSIVNNSCVLFLGPLFGENEKGEKLNKLLLSHLESDKIRFDTDFQNLFIKKAGDVTIQEMALDMKTFYNSVGNTIPPAKGSSTAVYRNVAKINFSAVIVFGQDNFLKNAFDEQGIKSDFRYYSAKGPQPSTDRSLQMKPPAGATGNSMPIVYNIYGNYTDPQSLITEYGPYYKFVFAILGDPNFFPVNLNIRISSAQVFLFLGFDLKKWYVPLLVNKFYNIGNTTTKSYFASSMNDTDVSNNEEYVNWLGRYPLNLHPVDDTLSFLQAIVDIPDGEKTGILRAGKNGSPVDRKKQEWLGQLAATSATELFDLIDRIIVYYEEAGNGEAGGFMTLQSGELSSAISEDRENAITPADFTTRVARVRRAIIEYLSR